MIPEVEALATLRLPALQARFAEIVGEETRCPNKTYLLRRIEEVLIRQAEPEEPTPTTQIEDTTPEEHTVSAQEPTMSDQEPTPPIPTRELDIEGLRLRYLEVVGRPTRSQDRRYLMWKIRQAERGQITVGPVNRRAPGEPPIPHKVLPLRMPEQAIATLDEIWRRQGLRSRMDLFRHALHTYLEVHDEPEAAALFTPRRA